MSAELVLTVLFPLIVLILVWKYVFIAPVKPVQSGYKEDQVIPHEEPIELYFADVSACSMKVRFCLAAGGVKYKQNVMKLPSANSWETKSRDFLKINPAGTVPVLVHNGHPIHDSSAQIDYIAKNLLPPGAPALSPKGANDSLIDYYWIHQTSWWAPELAENLDTALRRRVGNCIPIISIPAFAAIIKTLSWRTVFQGVLIAGFNDKQAFNILFGVLGVYAYKCFPVLSKLVHKGKKALFAHLSELEHFLAKKGTLFIGGDYVVLSDIGWAAILARMEYADWWEYVDPKVYPCVLRYWENMRKLPAYIEATRHIVVEEEHTLEVKRQIKEWKVKYPWFKSLYE